MFTFNIPVKEHLITGILPKNQTPYSLVLLDVAAMPYILDLQDQAFAAFPPEQRAFLLYREADFFEKHFSDNSYMLGIIAHGKLIAQSAILNPKADSSINMSYDTAPEKMTIMQGVIVHPDYRGNKLMNLMVRTWLGMGVLSGRQHALARVIIHNHYSWSVFVKEGMDIHTTCADPADGRTVYVLHRQIRGHQPADCKASSLAATCASASSDISLETPSLSLKPLTNPNACIS